MVELCHYDVIVLAYETIVDSSVVARCQESIGYHGAHLQVFDSNLVVLDCC